MISALSARSAKITSIDLEKSRQIVALTFIVDRYAISQLKLKCQKTQESVPSSFLGAPSHLYN